MSKIINSLLSESNTVSTNRPTLLAITQKIASQIYTDLIAVVPTTRPNTMVMGLRYQYDETPEKEIMVDAFSNGSGKTPSPENESFPLPLTLGDYFTIDGVEYQALQDTQYTVKPSFDDLMSDVYRGSIRVSNDAYSNEEKTYVPSSFILDGWKVEVATRKIGTSVTHELVTDLGSMNIESDSLIENMLVTSISHEINRDIISKLICVAKKSDPIGFETMYRESDLHDVLIRRIYDEVGRVAKETTFTPTWVLCSAGVAGIIKRSPTYNDGMLAEELQIIVDNISPVDYFMVGVKDKINDETVSPIYYSPLEDTSRGIYQFTFLEMNDSANLQPIYGCMTRYALSSNPYIDSTLKRQVERGDDWTKSANSSQLCRLVTVKLPQTK